jgi:phosphonate transport system substrate-binding protein
VKRRLGARFRLALLTAALSLLLPGCQKEPVATPDGRPAVIRLGYTPSEETVTDREAVYQALAAYLERSLGTKVELVRTASYGPAVEAMARGEIDVMSLGPLAYVLASQQGAAEVLVVTALPESGPRTYQSSLITHRRTGVRTLAELAERAGTLRLSYTDPASNSGHLVPQARLAALGLQPEAAFQEVDFSLSHSVSIFNVLFGRSDLAGVSASVLRRLQTKGRVPEDELVVLWESENLPAGPLAVRSALPAALKRELQAAMVALPQRDPATARVVMAQYPETGVVFLPGEDALYDGLRRLAQRMEPAR